MGAVCCKGTADPDPFSTPGRRLDSAAASSDARPTSKVPKRVGGPPRTLGDGANSNSEDTSASDARAKAAEAAEARAKASQAKMSGKLGAQLQQQRQMSRNEILQQTSDEARGYRDMDASVANLSHN